MCVHSHIDIINVLRVLVDHAGDAQGVLVGPLKAQRSAGMVVGLEGREVEVSASEGLWVGWGGVGCGWVSM